MLRVGELEIGFPAVQAALSGYSDLAMRRVARAHGAPFCFNEVVIDRDLDVPGRKLRRILELEPDDHPVGGQLMGAEPEAFASAAQAMVDAGYDTIDINFGCPVKRVMGRCRGGYHLGNPVTALAIVDEVLGAVAGRRPVTVKMRRGIDDSAEARRDFFRILDGAFERGVAAVTVHGRTVEQRYRGRADWSFLRSVKHHVGDRTVLGSGDLFAPEDIRRMLEETGVDGVTLARGCIGNPFLFTQVRELLDGRPLSRPSIEAQRQAIETHWRHARSVYGDMLGLRRTRTHAVQYARLHPQTAEVRTAFANTHQPEELQAVLDRFYPGAS